jgi:hypothetical protein
MQDVNNYFPWDEINEKDELLTGNYHLQIIFKDDGKSQSSGNRMIRIGFKVIAPFDAAGMSHFENYVVGTPEQPDAFNAGTPGAKNFKKLVIAAQIPRSNTVEELLNNLEQAEVGAAISYKPDADFKNNINSYKKIGEFTPEILATGPKAPVGRPLAPPVGSPAAAPAPAPAPVAPAVAAPVAPVAPAPIPAPAPVAVPVPPVAAPAPPAPPVTPAPVAASAAIPPVAAPPAQTVRCTLCNRDVDVMTFGAHVQRHATDPAWNGVD